MPTIDTLERELTDMFDVAELGLDWSEEPVSYFTEIRDIRTDLSNFAMVKARGNDLRD